MQEPIVLTEGGPSCRMTLSNAEFHALTAVGFLDITPTVEEGSFDISAGRRVGALTVGDRHIIVRPKIVDLNRLIFMVGYARDSKIWRDELVSLDAADELLPALAEAFSRITTRTLESGLLHGYRSVTDTLTVLRGRVLAGEQMSRHYGLPVPLAVEYDDFTADIAENQILAMATMRLLRIPRVTETARRLLRRLRRTLDEVTLPPSGSAVPRWQPSRLNSRYQTALRIAEIVLAAKSFEHHLGDLTISGYMFDMWRVFEDFVTVALGEALAARGWHCRAQAKLHLDVGGNVPMKPDLLCHKGLSTAVVDAKYKAEHPEGFPNADLYQLLAYSTALGLGEGHLVYAKGNGPVTNHTVQGSGTVIHCHALDLALPPAGLLGQIDGIAVRIVDSAAKVAVLSGANLGGRSNIA